MQSALRADALTSTSTGIAVRVGLPWIRSLPVACVREPALVIDGVDAGRVQVALGDRHLDPSRLADEAGWWFAQDRLVLELDRPLEPGIHSVVVSFRLLIPYLMAGPDGGPLELPMRLAGDLLLDHDPVPSVSLDVA
jgi:hypothetical protein